MNHPLEEKLYELLSELDIKYAKLEHDPLFTCEGSESFYKENNLDGAKCKSLFLRNRKGDRHFLALVESHTQIDVSKIAQFFNETQKMSFASPERLKKYLDLTPGSVTPFGLICPAASDISVLVDEGILNHEYTHFHPLRNTATLRLKTTDLMRFLESRPNKVSMFAF
jgi:Ala-tRNA(Pro) deacylase